MPTSPCRYPLARTGSADTARTAKQLKDGLTIRNRGLLMIDLSSAELQELIALIDAHLAELEEDE